MRRRFAFTLIELLVCSALAMVLAGLAVTAFFQLRRVVARAEARQGMYASAQGLYAYMERAFSGLQQSCAFVATRVQRDSAAATDPGEIRLVFMRAKESLNSYRNISATYVANDLTWELWVWNRAQRTLSIANNSIGDTSYPGRTFVSGAFSPAGVNYSGKRFYVTPQCRRTLDPADPFKATPPSGSTPGGLNDNILFPGAGGTSMANALQDVGDYTDLKNNLGVVLDNVSDLSFEILARDGASYVIDDSAAVAPIVLQGAWLDGRLAPSLTAAPAYASSDLSQRPRLVRLRFTLSDPKWRTDQAPLSVTFSFSFQLPGLSARQ